MPEENGKESKGRVTAEEPFMPCEGGETCVQWGSHWNVLNSSDMIRFSYVLEKDHLGLFMHIRLMLNKTCEETIAKTQMKNEGDPNQGSGFRVRKRCGATN